MNGICYMVGAGPMTEKELVSIRRAYEKSVQDRERTGIVSDFWIAVDGGIYAMARAGAVPDLLIGDFDSYDEYKDQSSFEDEVQARVQQWWSQKAKRTYPAEKDETDCLLAYQEGVRCGYRQFVIFGAAGGRPDHTMATYQMLAQMALDGNHVRLMGGDGWCMEAVADGTLTLKELAKGNYVSVFAISNCAEGVTLKGLKYPLDNGVLSNHFALGVSNQAVGERIEISVAKGILLVMWQTSSE